MLQQTQQTTRRVRGQWLVWGLLTAVVLFALAFPLVMGLVRYQFSPSPQIQAVTVRQIPYVMDVDVSAALADSPLNYRLVNLADVLVWERFNLAGRTQTQIALVLGQGRAAITLGNATGHYQLHWYTAPRLPGD